MSESTVFQRWTILLIIIFLTVVTFLFFHLYLRLPAPQDTTGRLTQLEEPHVTFINPKIGPDDAPVQIVEFGDYQCESCLEMSGILAVMRAEFGDQVQHVWKDFPNEDLHAQATSAAIAARCAQQQGRFWNFHDALFARQQFLSPDTYREVAASLELDIIDFNQCFENVETLPRVQGDFEEGVQLQITATPTIFINGERLTGLLSIDDVRSAIVRALNE